MLEYGYVFVVLVDYFINKIISQKGVTIIVQTLLFSTNDHIWIDMAALPPRFRFKYLEFC